MTSTACLITVSISNRENHTISLDTAERCLYESSESCTVKMAIDLSRHRGIALGVDGTNTYFDRSAFEVHITCGYKTELLGLCDTVRKDAPTYMKHIRKLWDIINDIR